MGSFVSIVQMVSEKKRFETFFPLSNVKLSTAVAAILNFISEQKPKLCRGPSNEHSCTVQKFGQGHSNDHSFTVWVQSVL
jgi:hypothetical protein